MRLFSVNYEVLRPVDDHPTGPRSRSVHAKNWMDASDQVRKVYGEEKADRIRVDAVFVRGENAHREFHYNRFGRSP